MTHLQLEYTPVIDDGRQLIEVTVLAGPARHAIRLIGELRLHPAELNALDRLLSRGAEFEAPANTYELLPSATESERQELERQARMASSGGAAARLEVLGR